jgi:hypothetical protein
MRSRCDDRQRSTPPSHDVFYCKVALDRYLAQNEHRIGDDDFAVLPPG